MPGDHIRIMCPSLTCRRVLAVPANSRGKNVRCKGCGATIRVPEKAPAPAAATPAPQTAPNTPNAKAA
jgi:hypothetical protein